MNRKTLSLCRHLQGVQAAHADKKEEKQNPCHCELSNWWNSQPQSANKRKWCHNDSTRGQLGGWWCRSAASTSPSSSPLSHGSQSCEKTPYCAPEGCWRHRRADSSPADSVQLGSTFGHIRSSFAFYLFMRASVHRYCSSSLAAVKLPEWRRSCGSPWPASSCKFRTKHGSPTEKAGLETSFLWS